MADKVKNTGVNKESGFLYYLDKNGHVSRTKMARGATKGGSSEVVANAGVQRESGWLYFIDKDGDVARTKMARGRKQTFIINHPLTPPVESGGVFIQNPINKNVINQSLFLQILIYFLKIEIFSFTDIIHYFLCSN